MFFRKPRKGSLILIVDVQSSIIRGALIRFLPHLEPLVIFTYTKNLPYKPSSDNSRLIELTVEATSEIMTAVYQYLHSTTSDEELPKDLDGIHYALSSPWIISEAKTVTINFNQPTTITKKLVLDTITNERKVMVPKTNISDDRISIIEEKIFNVKINGYHISSWQGRKASRLDVSFATSICSINTADLFKDICKFIEKDKIHFHSSILLQHIGIQYVLPKKDSYILVHVHGEHTDTTIVYNHNCFFFGSFAVGIYTLVRKIAHVSKTNFQVSDSALSIDPGEKTSQTKKDKMTEAVEAGQNLWIDAYKSHMDSPGARSVPSPSHAIILSHAHEKFMIRTLNKTYPKLQAASLPIENVQTKIKYCRLAEHVRLTGLYAIAINNILEHNI